MPAPVTDALADVTASTLAAGLVNFFAISAVEAKGTYKHLIRTARGHATHREWARILIYRRRGPTDQGPRATRSTGGKADDEGQQRHGDHYHYPE